MAVVATVMVAGIIGALAGVSGGGGLFAIGMGVLGGGAMSTLGGTLAAGFAAGFVGSIASQGVAKALDLQESVDYKGALISGLATAATGGLLRGLNNSPVYKGFVDTMEHLSISKTFSIASSAQLMEQNALSQGINLTFQKHQHFDWEQLGIAGVTGGFMGSTSGKKVDQTLRTVDHNTGILSSELRALTTAGAEATTGVHFDTAQVLSENLGSAIGSGIVDVVSEKDLAKLKLKEMDGELNGYCPIPSEEGAYSPIPEGTYERFHQEALAHQLAARSLEQEEEGSYEGLIYNSELFKSLESSQEEPSFERKIYWGENHGVNQLINNPQTSPGAMGLAFYDIDYSTLYAEKGAAYRKDQIKSYSYYNKSPGSPIWGDASKEMQRQSIDALISSSISYGLSLRDTAHVLTIARHESGFNPYAAPGLSSATGLGQFIDDTGKRYGITDATRWNIKVQADALVRHFLDNKALVIQHKLPEQYIYQIHHDGSLGHSKGLQISNESIVPKIGDITNVIRRIY